MIQDPPQTNNMSGKLALSPILRLGGAALVTGGGHRIGRATALMLATAGAPVIIHYNRSQIAAESLVAEIIGSGGRAAALPANLADAAAAAALCNQASQAIGGPIVCLINNASVFENDSPASFEADDFDTNMAIHARAAALIAQSMQNALPDNLPGVIINMLDQKVFNPDPTFFSYTISKYALFGLTEVLARAYAPRTRVNGVALGLTLPPPSMSPTRFAELQADRPLGSGASVEDVVDAVRFLVNAEKTTGQVICVDGGEHMAK